jgi:hypothetical protein
MREQLSIVQQVYEYVVRAGRAIRTREIVSAIGASSVSSVTFALTRLVREGNLERVGRGRYCVPQQQTGQTPESGRVELNGRLKYIFETIRPILMFEDLAYLYHLVLTAQRLAPDLFDERGG